MEIELSLSGFLGIIMKRVRFSDNARIVLEGRYLLRDDLGGVLETPEQMFRRVASNVAKRGGGDSSRWELDFVEAMMDLSFLPN